MKNELTFMELFAGAGGLSEGFIGTGFQPAAFIEMDKYSCLTLKTRMTYHYLKRHGKSALYTEYIKGNITREQLYSYIPQDLFCSIINEEIKQDKMSELFKKVKENMKRKNIKRINVLLGGPPCQSYSLIGRASDPYRMKNDSRNYLYKLYVEFLKEFKPDMFVFENVPGLLSAGEGKLWKDVQKYFSKAGYNVDYRILNAYDFGVLQNRKRIIAIGWRAELNLKYPEFKKDAVKKYKVYDILSDLPPLKPGDRLTTGEYAGKKTEYLTKYKIRNDKDILSLHIARKHNKRDRMIYKFYIENWLKKKIRPEYNQLPEYLKTHKNRTSFKDRFKVVAPDLPYSQTVISHLGKDGHYFIHPDINQLRSVSPREAARLQSFPDNFYFEGPMTAIFRQIGNAVPPLMAEKIALKIKETIQ
jgi:DNA (cytosine-5)-methyltransferase 1